MSQNRFTPTSNNDRVGAAGAFQPEMTANDLVEPVEETADPIIVHSLMMLLQAWAQTRKDLPDDFAQRFSIARVRRQPLAAIAVAAQHVKRELQTVDVPYGGELIDTRRWSTKDVFELIEVHPTEFPDIPESRKLRVVGQEEVHSCADCLAAGKTRCNNCAGQGTLTCQQCNGSRETHCPQCNGESNVVNASGNIVRCEGCRGKGNVGCPNCAAKGRVECRTCRRQGFVTCDTCEGHGQLKRSWQVDEQVWTEHSRKQCCSESWQLPLSELTHDFQPIAASHWAASPLDLDSEWQFLAPAGLHDSIHALLTAAAEKEGSPEQHRISGVRLELRGAYAYQVELEYHGASPIVVMVGQSGQILPRRLPKIHGVARLWIDRLLRNFWNEVEVDLRPTINGTYLRRVQDNKLHPWDVRELLPRVAAELGVLVTLTPAGYCLRLPVSSSVGIACDVDLNIALDIDDHGVLVLSSESSLGPAHRDRFPRVLSANLRLEFGRIAVVEEPFTGESQLCLVDRRPYEYAEPAGYADVLASLAYQVAEITAHRQFA